MKLATMHNISMKQKMNASRWKMYKSSVTGVPKMATPIEPEYIQMRTKVMIAKSPIIHKEILCKLSVTRSVYSVVFVILVPQGKILC